MHNFIPDLVYFDQEMLSSFSCRYLLCLLYVHTFSNMLSFRLQSSLDHHRQTPPLRPLPQPTSGMQVAVWTLLISVSSLCTWAPTLVFCCYKRTRRQLVKQLSDYNVAYRKIASNTGKFSLFGPVASSLVGHDSWSMIMHHLSSWHTSNLLQYFYRHL